MHSHRSILRAVAWLNASLLVTTSLSWRAAAAETPDRPLRVLFLGNSAPADAGNAPTKYAMLPGQSLAREAIYFDYRPAGAALSPAFLGHFDSVLVVGDVALSDEQKAALQGFAGQSGKVAKVPADKRADEAGLRAAVLGGVEGKALQDWQAFVAARAPLTYEKKGDIANYERRPEPLPLQAPLSARESMKYTQVPADFDLQFFAGEPDIFKPIAMAWDERGRLWVAETRDYPNEVRPTGEGNDDIKICEDTDGDGRADKFTVFADKLNIPTSLTFSNGGIVVAQAPHFLFLKDTDGDDKADVRQVLFEGAWGVSDTHAGPSNLHAGFDNWLYGTVGYSGFKSLSGPEKNFRQGVYRFKPDGSAIEFLHQFTNNTWGFGYNDAGDIFGSTANNAPSFFCGLPLTHVPAGQRLMSAKRINAFDRIHPNTSNLRQVDVMGGYTAAAGHMFMNSGALPERLRGKALVTEPTCKLINIFDVQPEGAGFKSLDGYNLLASADEWMSPVSAEVGPDGAVWVADWYNFIIQHNPTPSPERGGYKAENGKGGAHVNPNRDTTRGRIYRVVWKDGAPSAIKSLRGASPADLVKALGSDNQFWRLTAQRLLVDGKKADAVPALQAMVKTAGGVGAIHALWSLEGLGALDAESLRAALVSKDAIVRRNAIRSLGTDEAARNLYFGSSVLNDADLSTRLAAFVKLAEFSTTPEIKTLVAKLRVDAVNSADEWLNEGLKMLMKKHGVRAYQEGPNLLPNPGFEEIEGDAPLGWQLRSGEGEFKQSIAKGPEAGEGKNSLRLDGLGFEGANVALTAEVAVKPNTEYKLAGLVRANGVRGGLGPVLGVRSLRKFTQSVGRDTGWVEVETLFNSGANGKLVVEVSHGGTGKSTGNGRFDQISLTELTPEAEVKLAVGNPVTGEQIFRSHPLALCVQCHAVGGKGGNVGPALDGIASRKDAAYISESLLEPNAKLAEGFAGQVSPMPPMGLILKDQELADIKAYLMSLKAK